MTPSTSRISSDFRLFGIDLAAGFQGVSTLWSQVLAGPPFTWAVRPAPVQVLRADGRVQIWRRGRFADAAPNPPATSASASTPASASAPTTVRHAAAAEIPDDLVLRHHCTMPPMPAAQLEQALLLELQSVSPFPPESLVSGWALALNDRGQTVVHAALASRVHLQRVLPDAAATLGVPLDQLEAWVLPAPEEARSRPRAARGVLEPVAHAGAPIVMRGFGEAIRQRDALRQRRRGYLLLGLAALLLATIAITPTVQLWLRSEEAAAAFATTQERTRAAVAVREKFIASSKSLKALDSAVGESAAPLRVLDVLTNVLPDDTYVQTVQIEGTKVSFTGLTDNAAALMSRLGETPGVRELRASQAATRQIGAAKESFGVEFRLDIPGVVPRAASASATGEGGGASANPSPSPSPQASPSASSTATPASGKLQNSVSNVPPAVIQQAQPAIDNIVSTPPRPYYPKLAPAEQAPAGSSSVGGTVAPAGGNPPAAAAAPNSLSRASIGGSARPPAPAPAAAPAPNP